jgi:hypothetical protein
LLLGAEEKGRGHRGKRDFVSKVVFRFAKALFSRFLRGAHGGDPMMEDKA